MRSFLIVPALLLVVAAAVFVAEIKGAQRATTVGVTLTEFKVNMTSTSVPAGVPVTFAATNKGQTLHELVLEKAGADDQPLEMNGGEAEIEDIAPGETKSATWTITQPGVYQLACHMQGHFDAGMVQQFMVLAVSGGQAAQMGAPVQFAAPSAEERAEHEDRPAAGAAMLIAATAPTALPVIGRAGGLSLLWLASAATAAEAIAIYGAFRLIVNHIGVKE
ncbi:MAG: cupredoxin domain-containing protein [Nitrososphaerales archaeon]